MSTRYYGASLGAQRAADVTEAGSTTSLAIELAVVYTTTNMVKIDVVLALEAILEYVRQDTWPPA